MNPRAKVSIISSQHSESVLAGVLCVRAGRRPISKGSRGMQIILKKFCQKEKLGI
jgi:hypothetical protein